MRDLFSGRPWTPCEYSTGYSTTCLFLSLHDADRVFGGLRQRVADGSRYGKHQTQQSLSEGRALGIRWSQNRVFPKLLNGCCQALQDVCTLTVALAFLLQNARQCQQLLQENQFLRIWTVAAAQTTFPTGQCRQNSSFMQRNQPTVGPKPCFGIQIGGNLQEMNKIREVGRPFHHKISPNLRMKTDVQEAGCPFECRHLWKSGIQVRDKRLSLGFGEGKRLKWCGQVV